MLNLLLEVLRFHNTLFLLEKTQFRISKCELNVPIYKQILQNTTPRVLLGIRNNLT